jgi:plasmid stabilization system protein ParE
MVREVIWNDQALADVESIKDYIGHDSLARAEAVVAAIERAAEGLSDFPYRCRKIPEFEDRERRETFVYEYRLMYRVEPTCIRILAPGPWPPPSQQRTRQP